MKHTELCSCTWNVLDYWWLLLAFWQLVFDIYVYIHLQIYRQWLIAFLTGSIFIKLIKDLHQQNSYHSHLDQLSSCVWYTYWSYIFCKMYPPLSLSHVLLTSIILVKLNSVWISCSGVCSPRSSLTAIPLVLIMYHNVSINTTAPSACYIKYKDKYVFFSIISMLSVVPI